MSDQLRQRVAFQSDGTDLAHVVSLHEAEHYCRVVLSCEREYLFVVGGAGQVQQVGAGFKAGLDYGRFVGFDRDQNPVGAQRLNHRHELLNL